MAAQAYVLVSIEPARTNEVLKRLKDTLRRGIVQEVLGPYDAVIELDEETAVDLTHAVRSKIRSVPGVTNTITCMWVESADIQAGGE